MKLISIINDSAFLKRVYPFADGYYFKDLRLLIFNKYYDLTGKKIHEFDDPKDYSGSQSSVFLDTSLNDSDENARRHAIYKLPQSLRELIGVTDKSVETQNVYFG